MRSNATFPNCGALSTSPASCGVFMLSISIQGKPDASARLMISVGHFLNCLKGEFVGHILFSIHLQIVKSIFVSRGHPFLKHIS